MSLISSTDQPTTALHLVRSEDYDSWLETQSDASRAWLERLRFRAESGQVGWLASDAGAPTAAVVGWDGTADLATLGGLPYKLPEGAYTLATEVSDLQLAGWGLGAYRFDRYKASKREPAELLLPAGNDAEFVNNLVSAITLVRDLINMPADGLDPAALADEAAQLAAAFDAECRISIGDELLAAGFGAIHAVGRAATVAPRLVDIEWGNPDHPQVVLVGKGVCFDSGGLDLKPAAGMRIMKKDMGGAAHVLGLAQLIMASGLPVRLRVLVSAVENAVAGNAYRPGDVLQTYQGLTVEIDNTDAEGRLVMCDALALAAEAEPDLIIDFSTLTGSARSAVGPEIAAMFSNDDSVADGLLQGGAGADDPVWRLPLHEPYGHMLESKVADTVNSASSPMGGAITAALFLQKFVGTSAWAHFDIMAYNTRARPGRPEGGEAMGLRATFDYLRSRYGD